MSSRANPTATLTIHQRGQLQTIANTETRWCITPGNSGSITVKYKTDCGWAEYGTLTAQQIELHDTNFSNDHWIMLEWVNPETNTQYRLCTIGPHTAPNDTHYTVCVQKQTHTTPTENNYVTVQRVQTDTIPQLHYL